MFTQLVAHLRFGPAFRTLALALMLTSAIAPAALVDHMGNHLRGPSDSESTDTTAVACGSEPVAISSEHTALYFVSDPADTSDTDAPADTVPTYRHDGHPW